jgi:hypothetical protein
MNRAAKRLAGYVDECLARAAKGGRHWLRLPLAEFMRATGYAERTARQAWADVRELYESRAVRRGRSFVSMVALLGTLSPCKTQYKGGIPSELEKVRNTEQARQAAPGRSKFSEAAPAKPTSPAAKDPLRRLAAFFGSRLLRCHWDSCRVRFNAGFAQAYAARAFALGYDRATVEAAYEAALRAEHAVAVDVGAPSWRPFRVMALALARLAAIAPNWTRPATPAPRAARPAADAGLSDALAAFCAGLGADDPFATYTPYERTR